MTEEQIGALMSEFPRIVSILPRGDWVKLLYTNSKNPSQPHVWTHNKPFTREALEDLISYHKELK